jgi:hypothetical protein
MKIHIRRAGTDLNEARAIFFLIFFFEGQEMISTKRALATVGDAAKHLLDTAYYYICVLILLLYMCPHITICGAYYYTCVLILLHVAHASIYVSACYYMWRILLYVCPHITICGAYCYICVLILLYVAHTAIYVSSYYSTRHTTICVSSYYYMWRILLYVCPRITICGA